MGFGQHTTGTRHDYPETPRVGRRTKADLMPTLAPGDRAIKWGHNRLHVTRANGDLEWRLHDTAILTVHPNGDFTINTGGWRTPTTAQAIQEARQLAGLGYFSYWHDKKRGGCVLGIGKQEFIFGTRATFHGARGKWHMRGADKL